jgi:peptidoglycan/LPS O-acetylase OafA/YrhL
MPCHGDPSCGRRNRLVERIERAVNSGEPPNPARIRELDGLRGLAILAVLLCHYLSGQEHGNLTPWLRQMISASNIGWTGVDLFFVLSGFLIGGILLDERDAPHYFRAFYLRRVHRILPIYYGWTLLFAVVVLASFSGWFGLASPDRGELWVVPVQLAFIQNLFSSWTPLQTKWFAATWSLAVEEQFYLFVPLLIRWLPRRRLVAILVAIVCLAPFLRLLVFRYGPLDGPRVLLPCRADALAMGALLAAGWRNVRFRDFLRTHERHLQISVLLLLAGVLAMLRSLIGGPNLVQATIGYTWMAVLFGGLLLLALAQSPGWFAAAMRWAWLRSLGEVSYCVYLVHFPFLFFAHQWITKSGPRLESWRDVGVTALALAATMGFAALSWRWLEKPMIRAGHRHSYRES